jgi:hypothetical protein
MALPLFAIWNDLQEEFAEDKAKALNVFNAVCAQNAKEDLLCYGWWVHGRHPTLQKLALSRHAHLWAELLEDHSNVLLVCPPEHGKTTFMRWHIEQWIGKQTEALFTPETTSSTDGPTSPPFISEANRAPSALLVMNAALQAQRQCMSIAATIEANARYRRLFPHVIPDPKWGWTKDVLYCKRPFGGTAQPDPTLQVTGIPGPIQGARIGLCVVDDPTDQQDAHSETVMMKQKEFHQGVLADRLLEGALWRDIMTRWHKQDIPEMLMQSESWKAVSMPALGQLDAKLQEPLYPESYPEYPWGKALWPELWPEERLEAKRKEKLLVRDSGLWQLSYMCSPTPVGGNLFKREWLRYEQPNLPWGQAA